MQVGVSAIDTFKVSNTISVTKKKETGLTQSPLLITFVNQISQEHYCIVTVSTHSDCGYHGYCCHYCFLAWLR